MKLEKSFVSIVLVCMQFGLVGCKKDPTGILITGLDEKGKLVEVLVPAKNYPKHVEKLMNAVVDESFTALDQIEAKEKKYSWMPSKIVVGLGLSASVGLGKVLTAEVEPEIEFVFKKTNLESN
ncbi:MAG: hypothetical protein PHY93_17355 [Bacteriovorax sp.]|nr:hypothetical protein [Bacteriovorax sp.]